MKIVDAIELARPFTLLPPAVGIISGATVAYALAPGISQSSGTELAAKVLPAVLSAMLLNAASNAINQYFDVDIDRINKPQRPLPRGSLSAKQALICSIIFYMAALFAALPAGWLFFWAIVATAALTLAYSVPPLRLKRRPVMANINIAAARGLLLPVVGYTALAPPMNYQIWLIAVTMAIFIFGAAMAKDFGDMKGDAVGGVVTLPILLGALRAAKLMRWIITVPQLILATAALGGLLTGNKFIWVTGAGMLAFAALNTAGRAVKAIDAGEAAALPAIWSRLYLVMIAMQLLVAVAYLYPA